jgi:uncharacterized protein YjbI with pentapeptide repeats
MLTEHQDFERAADLPLSVIEDGVFRYCNFTGLEIDGPSFDGTLIGCFFDRAEWYGSLFNCTDFLSTRFQRCVFLGATFAGCRLIGCRFEECRFGLDNLSAPSSFEKCLLADTGFERCEIVLSSPSNRPVFVANRVYGCTQTACQGFDALFDSPIEMSPARKMRPR